MTFARELIRIDTTNTGDNDSCVGERAAAEYVAEKLADAGAEPHIFESKPGRASVVARIAGVDQRRPGLVLHGHLDVVPAVASDWRIHPFSGEIQDGYLWGRGAVDMKNMDAMILAITHQWARTGERPPRDVVIAFFADEEAGGALGARHVVTHHPELFDGCDEAIGEVGGFSLTLAENVRAYTIATAEKGLAWLRLSASGVAGHGSMMHAANAVTALAEVVTRLGRHTFPMVLTDTAREFLQRVSVLLQVPFDENDPQKTVDQLGSAAKLIGATIRNTANPTMLNAGYKANVIPAAAEAVVDCRILPGQEKQFLQQLDELMGAGVSREWIEYLAPLQVPYDAPIVRAMSEALKAEDSQAHAVPYMLSGGTDAKSLAGLGIRGYGFVPLKLPPDLDFAALFHGVDERVPVDALRFGVRVLHNFLAHC